MLRSIPPGEWQLYETMRDASGVATQVPLATLLSWTWIAFAIKTANEQRTGFAA